MISTRSVELVIDTVVCLTLAKWETVSGQFGGYLTYTFGRLAVRLLLRECLTSAKARVIHVAGRRRSGQTRSRCCRRVLFRRLGQFRSDHRTPPRLHRPSHPAACSGPTSLLSAVTVPVALAAFGRGRPRLRQGHRVEFGQRCRRPAPVVRQDRRAPDLVVRRVWVSVQ